MKNLIRSVTENSDDYDEKYMKIRCRAVFHKNNKYYSQVLLDKGLYKL